MTKTLVRQHGPALLTALAVVVLSAGLLHGLEIRLAHSSPQVLARLGPAQGFVGTFAGEAPVALSKVLAME